VSVPLAYALCLIAFPCATVCAWQVRRALREPLERDRIAREARARTGLADHMPGIDSALQDACELIWHLPAHGTPDSDLDGFCDRLRDAITEHRQQEGGND
jgi:hypothetical protein